MQDRRGKRQCVDSHPLTRRHEPVRRNRMLHETGVSFQADLHQTICGLAVWHLGAERLKIKKRRKEACLRGREVEKLYRGETLATR